MARTMAARKREPGEIAMVVLSHGSAAVCLYQTGRDDYSMPSSRVECTTGLALQLAGMASCKASTRVAWEAVREQCYSSVLRRPEAPWNPFLSGRLAGGETAHGVSVLLRN